MSAFALALEQPKKAVDSPLQSFAVMLGEIEATPSKNEKQQIIARYLSGKWQEGIGKLLNYALSPYERFGVASLEEDPESPMTGANTTGLVKSSFVFTLLLTLASERSGSVRTRDNIKYALSLLDSTFPQPVSEREALRRILLKDLRAGFSESTVNKVQKGLIPTFDCQLANSEMPDISTLDYPVIVQPKYDGVRCIAIKRNRIVTLFSRNGIEFTNFAEVQDLLAQTMPDNFVLDGEMLHGHLTGEEGYQLVMKRAKASPGKNDTIPISYRAFDAMALSEWESQNCPHNLVERRNILRQTLESMVVAAGAVRLDDLVRQTPTTVCYSQEQLQEVYESHLAEGWEGVIIKIMNGDYTFKRNKTWMKLKPFGSVDLKVVSAVAGNGKYADSLGAIVCVGEYDGKEIKVEVGSGFTDQQRNDIWKAFCTDVQDALDDPDSAAGNYQFFDRIVEVRYQALIKAQDSDVWSLRFPTFLRFRETDSTGKM